MTMKKLQLLALALLIAMLSACSQQDAASDGGKGTREVSVQAIAAEAKGFTVGAVMSATTIYVFFDPQCPHCGHLWNASMPLHKKVKFVWIPVAWIKPASLPQGAALLSSANPTLLMTEHENSILAGTGGISAASNVPAETEKAIQANTQLLNSFGAASVPYVVFKDAASGKSIGREGATTTAELAAMAGVDL